MNNFAAEGNRKKSNAEVMGKKRQEKALREFKQVLEDLVFMLRSASEMETVYMYWVNRSREQFVMETKSTVLNDVMFKDRIDFDKHFLDTFKDITEPTAVEVGKDIPASALNHYYNNGSVQYVTLLPFINNGETVAITVMESTSHIFNDSKREIIYSYISAIRNVLNTYLEISDLQGQQDEWINYESALAELDIRCQRSEMINKLLNIIQGFLNNGGVSFITKGNNGWFNTLNSEGAKGAPKIGLAMADRSLAYEAIEQGEPEFAIHFNNNPKRLSPREHHSKGATLAIPLVMDDRRQGVVLVYDENPLIFKESTKHKIINLVRVACLKIQAHNTSLNIDEPIFANKYGAFFSDIWEITVGAELNRLKSGNCKYGSQIGLVSLTNLPELRTKLRLEELNTMQRSLVSALNPTGFGYPGIIGYHSDYVYSFFIQNKDPDAVEKWIQALQNKFNKPFEIKEGKMIKTGLKFGCVTLDETHDDAYQLITEAKSALSQAINSTQNEAV